LKKSKKQTKDLNIQTWFIHEVERLSKSGGFDSNVDNLNTLFAVALDTISDNFAGSKNYKAFKSLKTF